MLLLLPPNRIMFSVVSYKEFLTMFHAKRTRVFDNLQPMESTVGREEGLIGLDAKIPGGCYDSTRSGA